MKGIPPREDSSMIMVRDGHRLARRAAALLGPLVARPVRTFSRFAAWSSSNGLNRLRSRGGELTPLVTGPLSVFRWRS